MLVLLFSVARYMLVLQTFILISVFTSHRSVFSQKLSQTSVLAPAAEYRGVLCVKHDFGLASLFYSQIFNRVMLY